MFKIKDDIDIKMINKLIKTMKEERETSTGETAEAIDYFTKALENLINKNKEQEKIIELMSNSIHQLVTQNDIAKYFQKRYCKAFYSEDISKCKDLICEECVKNYFIKKAKEVIK